VEGSNNVTKKHHAIEYNVHVDIITVIWHFLLVVPIPAFCFRPINVFLEFYLPLYTLYFKNQHGLTVMMFIIVCVTIEATIKGNFYKHIQAIVETVIQVQGLSTI